MTSMPRSLTGPLGAALVSLAAPDGVIDPDAVDRVLRNGEGDLLARLAEHHRLEAPLVTALRSLDRRIPSELSDRVAAQRATRMRAAAALEPLRHLMSTAGVEWVLVKGPIVATQMRHPEHRSFNDLDLVVTSSDFGRALDALIEAGARELNRNWDAYLRYGIGEVPLEFQGVALDLHWSIVGLGTIRKTMRVPTDEMVRRRVDMSLADTLLPTFEPTDRLIHLCLHAALSGATRLDQLRDITVEIGDGSAVDWQALDRRVHAAAVAPLVGHAFDRAAIVLGACVPDASVRNLGGVSSRIRRLIDATGSTRRPALRGVPVKVARNSWRARWLARAAVLPWEAARRLGHQRSWDFADQRSEIYTDTDAGGPAARRAFIDSVG